MRAIIALLAFLAVTTASEAATVAAAHGRIVLNGKAITTGARDSGPVLSPDGERVVFVRDKGGKPRRDCSASGDATANLELWSVGADGRGDRKLLAVRTDTKVEATICAFDSLQFSSNGQLLYFETPAWATSGALHVYDFKNGRERFVLASNGAEVLSRCADKKYRDDLIVSQHRYFVFAGSYDWLWLFSPDGKEIGPVGENDTMARDACS